MGFVGHLKGIQWEFLGDFGAAPGFPRKSGIGAVRGNLGSRKALAQTDTFWDDETRPLLKFGPAQNEQPDPFFAMMKRGHC